MAYTFNIKHFPSTFSFFPLNQKNVLVASIAAEKRVNILIEMNSKTCIDVSAMAGETCLQANYIPAGCESLKFHSTVRNTVWNSYTTYFFKILKNQKWNEFKHYITCFIDSLNIPYNPAETITVNLCMRSDVREKLAAPEYGTCITEQN